MKEFAFISSQDFEEFTSQLFSLELPSFMAVKGAGGDGGLDGLEGTTVYQMYFADPKNRTAANYIKKIDHTLARLQDSIAKDGLDVTRMILVTPEDLPSKAVIHLQKRSKETGIECLSWGASQLTAILAKHPQIRDNFPEVLLPDIKTGITSVQQSLVRMSAPRTEHSVEIVTDQQYREELEELRSELRARYRSAQSLNGPATEPDTFAYRDVMDKKFKELYARKADSDRAYELDAADIRDHFEQERNAKDSELKQRGVRTSGFGQKDLQDIDDRMLREIERLRMKYGKDGGFQFARAPVH